jgi:hypothetical protein
MGDGLRELVDAWLTPASSDVRAAERLEPGDWDDLTRDEYVEVKRAAEEIVEFVSERLETDEN